MNTKIDSRNGPCSCGSNMKFKKCCGTAEKHNIRMAAEAEALQKRREAYREKQDKLDAEYRASGKPRPSVMAATALLGA